MLMCWKKAESLLEYLAIIVDLKHLVYGQLLTHSWHSVKHDHASSNNQPNWAGQNNFHGLPFRWLQYLYSSIRSTTSDVFEKISLAFHLYPLCILIHIEILLRIKSGHLCIQMAHVQFHHCNHLHCLIRIQGLWKTHHQFLSFLTFHFTKIDLF